jgi:hypothetical protein
MTKRIADELKVGDVIMPPPRELQLWMRRDIAKRGLPESALHLTITNIVWGTPDKRGRWLLVTADHAIEWHAGRKPYPIKFKVRPETPWEVVSAADASDPMDDFNYVGSKHHY